MLWEYFRSCSASVSLLGNLEPLLATAFGINVAYLSLARFRHRSKIRAHAKENLNRFKDGGTRLPSRLESNKWYKEVSRLACLEDHDSDLPKTNNGKTTLPDGHWPIVYCYLFEYHVDKKLCTVFSVSMAALLLIGVAHQVFIFTPVKCLFSASYIPFTFWLAVCAAVLPALFMLLGKRVVNWGTHYSTECVDSLLELMQDDVKHAALTDEVAAKPAK